MSPMNQGKEFDKASFISMPTSDLFSSQSEPLMIGTYNISQATTTIRMLIHGKLFKAKILDLPILSGKYKNWYAFI